MGIRPFVWFRAVQKAIGRELPPSCGHSSHKCIVGAEVCIMLFKSWMRSRISFFFWPRSVGVEEVLVLIGAMDPSMRLWYCESRCMCNGYACLC